MAAGPDFPRRISAGTLVLCAAIPLLFLHSIWQPSVSVSAGGTSVTAYLSDFAVLAVVVAAALALRTRPLHGRPLWVVGACFFLWLAFEVAWGRHVATSYPVATHATTAAKFLEYALLAPAVVVLVRTRGELLAVLWTLTGWSCAATVVGLAQFFGSHMVGGKGLVGHRQTSFLSDADFAALSAAALVVGVVGLAVPALRLPLPLSLAATITGALGVVVAGAVAAVFGLATAAVVVGAAALRRRLVAPRTAVVAAVALAAAAAGVVAIRGTDLEAFAKFVGASPSTQTKQTHIQTYAHHTLLAWIGYRIWRGHPLLGVGWEGSAEPANVLPVLPAAHDRFPNEAAQAFPGASPSRRYGVQNVWIQALADLGVVGFALWVATFATAAWTAWRADVLPGLLALGWIALVAWLWASQSFVAGIPLDALTWLGIGLAAARIRTA